MTIPTRRTRRARLANAHPPTRLAGERGGRFAAGAEVALALGVALVAAAALYVPPAWRADFRPFPDAEEYAITARRLAHLGGYALRLLGRDYPPRYPFGFPALLAPAYWLPGATLANGLYGVVAFGALGVALTYLLGRLLYGRLAGLLAAAALLLLPPYLAWNHALMGETATVALTAAVALLVALAMRALERGERRRAIALLGALGAVGGVAIVVRLTNAIPVGAALLGLLAGGGPRREWRRVLPALAAGPVAALVALAVYGQYTFGSVAGTGYRYWVPEWYGSLGTTFSWRYAFVAPGMTGDGAAPAGLPNLLYYARGLAGLLPDRSSLLLTGPFALLAFAGAARLLADRRRPARAVGVYAAATAVALVAVYAAYFLPDVRFLAPLAPLAALGVGERTLPGLAVLALIPALNAVGGSADTAMVADLVPPERHEAGYAATRVASNFGVTLGPVLGGLLLALAGWNALFVGVAVLCAAATAIAWRWIPHRGAYSPEAPPERGRARVILRDRPFLVYLFSGILASFVYVAYETVLPISLTTSHGLSAATWGFLVIVNPALVTAFQLRLTRRTERYSPAAKLAVALPLMGLPFLLLEVSSAIPVVVCVIVVFVFGEMLWIPSSQSVVARLAPADVRGAYMGAFGISWSIAWALGPFLGLQVHAAAGDGATWTMFAAMSVVAGTVGALAAAGAARARPALPSAA
ncbi:MAG TPA: MFS transporter [Thermomicrobiales bacterium]|nr:MFS transporter [Thermomicrobiales bacterium]